MSLDPYASCPCGSGKKFKWCCQPIFTELQHVWDQESNGQHETALKLMEQLTQEHANNPEVWGQQARLQAVQGNLEAAEESLEKAFALQPNFPFGLLLRAQFRHAEGEFQGALLLARKAVEAYAADAREPLSEAMSIIFDCEMRLNRPVAGRAALERLEFLVPDEERVSGSVERVFGAESRFPAAASKAYTFHKPSGTLQGERRQAWNQALGNAQAKLSDVVRAFEDLTEQDPKDAAAWFNLGLAQAWQGDNAAALTALDHYVEVETNEEAAVEAAVLMEVLRLGHGIPVEQCDYREYSFLYQITRFEPVQAMLQEWVSQTRLLPLPTEQEGLFVGMVLELSSSGLVTTGRPAQDSARVAGYVAIVGNVLRFTTTIKDRYDRVKEEVRQKLSLGLTDLREEQGTAQYQELLTEALSVPLSGGDKEDQTRRAIEQSRRFFEETWIHRPLKSLSNIAPVDAVGHTKLRRKLLGVIAMLEQVAKKGLLAGYDFDQLRRRLGLLGQAGAAPAAAASTGAPAAIDFGAMSAADLSALKAETLSDEQLEKAYQSAYRLDAMEIADHFARALVQRPVQADRPDRFPWYSFLIQKALREGQHDRAMDDVNEGEKLDCEHNGGKRRNDYELFRAQVHTRRGEIESARDVFQRLIERVPRDFKIRGKAIETMLAAKEAGQALKLAEDGVKAAREANDRDSENYLMELAEAARRKMG